MPRKKASQPETEWLKVSAVAIIFDVSIGTVYYWIKVKKYFRIKMKGSRYQVSAADVARYREAGFALDALAQKVTEKAAKSA